MNVTRLLVFCNRRYYNKCTKWQKSLTTAFVRASRNPFHFISTQTTRSREIQQEETKNNPITFNNTELQTENGLESEDYLDQLNRQNNQKGVCQYCKSPDHYMNLCPKLKRKRYEEGRSQQYSNSKRVNLGGVKRS